MFFVVYGSQWFGFGNGIINLLLEYKKEEEEEKKVVGVRRMPLEEVRANHFLTEKSAQSVYDSIPDKYCKSEVVRPLDPARR